MRTKIRHQKGETGLMQGAKNWKKMLKVLTYTQKPI